MHTRYIVETVMLALGPGQHTLSALELTTLCRGDTPHLEHRQITHIERERADADAALDAARADPRCVMAAVYEWRGVKVPVLGKPGSLHTPSEPRLTTLTLWERPYAATVSRYGPMPGITVRQADWQCGTSDVTDWPIGGGEWPKWSRPVMMQRG